MQTDEHIWEQLLDIQNKGKFDFYFVGGCVRDLCYGIHSSDIDIVFKGDTDELFELLRPSSAGSTIQKSSYSTLSLRGEVYEFDFASPRKDEYPGLNGIPNIERASLVEDMSRRDFTINTGYLELSHETIRWIKGEPPKLQQIMSKVKYAHPMFESDIKNRKLRILHTRSFEEDPSRLLRAVKYDVLLNLTLEKESEIFFRRALRDKKIEKLEKSRYLRIVWDYIRHNHSEELMKKLDEHDLLTGSLKYVELVDQVDYLKSLWNCDSLDKTVILYVTMFYDHKEQMKTIGHLINATVKEAEHILEVIKGIEGVSDVKKRYQAYKVLYNRKVESIACANLISGGSEWIALYMNELRYVKLHLTGKDLLRLGVAEGPVVGKLMEELLIYKLNENPTMDVEGEIRWIESAKNETGN